MPLAKHTIGAKIFGAFAVMSIIIGLMGVAGYSVLSAAGDNLRTAIVMAKRGVNREEAERLLAASGNVVSAALGER